MTVNNFNLVLNFQGSQTLGGTGQVALGNGASLRAVGNGTQAGAAVLTIGPNITVTEVNANGGNISGVASYDSIVNQGTINANISGNDQHQRSHQWHGDQPGHDGGLQWGQPGHHRQRHGR